MNVEEWAAQLEADRQFSAPRVGWERQLRMDEAALGDDRDGRQLDEEVLIPRPCQHHRCRGRLMPLPQVLGLNLLDRR